MKNPILLVPSLVLLAACGSADNASDARQLGPFEPKSTVYGDVNTRNAGLPVGEINVSVRGTDTVETVTAGSEYSVSLPQVDSDQFVVLDFHGDNVVETSLRVLVPANAESVEADVDIAARTAPIAFNLDVGGELKNPNSATRTSVTVPPNAFELPDGSIATGPAFVSITEINIQDTSEESAWVPNLVGLEENGSGPVALTSFGMSDFHFYQGDQKMQLRPGVQATLRWDLLSPYTMSPAATVPQAAQDGDVMPLWHYDPQDMIWKEEGDAVISSDAGSDSGFSVAGDVSHFSTWNLDYVVPSMLANINLFFEDVNGTVYEGSDSWAKSYRVTARIPPDAGRGWHGESAWRNTKVLTPQDRKILVLANDANRQWYIDNFAHISGWTEMELTIDEIVLDDAYVAGMGMDFNLPVSQRKIFRNYDGDDTVTFSLPIGSDSGS